MGQRNANSARAAVERFSPLTCDWRDGGGVRTLREDIANFLGQYRDSLETGMGYGLHWILFINDEHRPEVEIRLNPPDGDKPGQVYNYVDPEIEAEEGLVREAAVIGPILFSELAGLLHENVTEDAPA